MISPFEEDRLSMRLCSVPSIPDGHLPPIPSPDQNVLQVDQKKKRKASNVQGCGEHDADGGSNQVVW